MSEALINPRLFTIDGERWFADNMVTGGEIKYFTCGYFTFSEL